MYFSEYSLSQNPSFIFPVFAREGRLHDFPRPCGKINLPIYPGYVKVTGCFLYHSFRIAARGLNFIARRDGKNPAAMPTNTANTTADAASHRGILEMSPSTPIMAWPRPKKLFMA